MHFRDGSSFSSQCYICKMDYIKDFTREYRLGQLGPGVVEEKSPLAPRNLRKRGFGSSRLRPFYPLSTGSNSINPLRTQPCHWFPPKPLNSMHPPLETDFTAELPFDVSPSLLPLSYPPDQVVP